MTRAKRQATKKPKSNVAKVSSQRDDRMRAFASSLGRGGWMRLRADILSGDPLPREAAWFVVGVLGLVADGINPCDVVGTKRGRGRPKQPNVVIGLHYLLLAHTGKGTAAMREVCELYGCDESTVERAARSAKRFSIPDDPEARNALLDGLKENVQG